MHTQHSHKPASFHLSPQDAMGAPREDFLYVVCTRAGTDVESSGQGWRPPAIGSGG